RGERRRSSPYHWRDPYGGLCRSVLKVSQGCRTSGGRTIFKRRREAEGEYHRLRSARRRVVHPYGDGGCDIRSRRSWVGHVWYLQAAAEDASARVGPALCRGAISH